MTEPHPRYIGVARVPTRPADPPPRVVIDLTTTRRVPPPAVWPTAPPPHPSGPRPITPPPKQQRGLRRRTLRGFEVTAWLAVIGIVVSLGAYLLTAPSQRAEWIGTPPVGAAEPGREIAPVVPGYAAASPAPCAFDSCAAPAPVGSPTRIRIAKIGVNSALEQLSLDGARRLVPPHDVAVAGWYAQGPIPGDPGAAVIAGHVDSYQGAGVFFQLYTLHAGDVIEVQRGSTWLRFAVTAIEQYPKNKFPTDKVYQPTPDAQLRVITCGGDFDEKRLSYRDNIVVYARQL